MRTMLNSQMIRSQPVGNTANAVGIAFIVVAVYNALIKVDIPRVVRNIYIRTGRPI
jgi:hypothetical protein